MSFEALLRWEHPTQGLISPYRFIDAAEDTGILVSIGHWLMVQACRQLREWEVNDRSGSPMHVTVNVSARQFADARLANDIQDALKIDRSLIREMQTDRSASDIVELISLLAHKMNLKVIAEGIETARQLERLLELGCEYEQGYFFLQPMEAKAALIFMRQQLVARKSASTS
jgi:EAL domain-containing protein (putative c-di-GMP-specific phosphodiesterase class I)